MLSKTTEYAIRSLVYISVQNKKGLRPGFKEIAKEINSPEQFTAKVLQKLTKNKLVHSMKGRGGGFFFSENEFPSLYDTIIIMEGENYFTKCGFGLKKCDSARPCPLHNEYMVIRDIFNQLARKTSIQALADKVIESKAVLI